MIIFVHSKCKRYENRKIQGVALPKKERNGQEWKSSHHGTHHGEQDYGAVLLQVVLLSIALESPCQPIGRQEQDKQLVEAIEYTNHPFYIGVQYHPEFKSRPNRPHPLFVGLVKASLENKESQK